MSSNISEITFIWGRGPEAVSYDIGHLYFHLGLTQLIYYFMLSVFETFTWDSGRVKVILPDI